MYLYNLTLQPATGIVSAINVNFAGGKTQEIAVARGKVLDLLCPDDNGDDSLVQVHPSGIRHIREDGRVNEWRTPGKRANVKDVIDGDLCEQFPTLPMDMQRKIAD